METRRAYERDLASIMEIERSCFSIPWSEESMRYELDSPDAVFSVAEERGEILGFAVLHISLDEAELYNIAVRESARRSGVGAALIERTLSEAAGLGVKTAYLEVRKSNAAARELYKKAGFAVCGERRGYYDDPKEDAVLMDVDVSEHGSISEVSDGKA